MPPGTAGRPLGVLSTFVPAAVVQLALNVPGIAFQELPRPCPASRRHGVTSTPPNATAYQRMLNRKPTA